MTNSTGASERALFGRCHTVGSVGVATHSNLGVNAGRAVVRLGSTRNTHVRYECSTRRVPCEELRDEFCSVPHPRCRARDIHVKDSRAVPNHIARCLTDSPLPASVTQRATPSCLDRTISALGVATRPQDALPLWVLPDRRILYLCAFLRV